MEKPRILAFLLILGLTLSAGAQDRGLLRFETLAQTVDTVRFDSGTVTLRYPFENVSGKTVTILEVRSTCGCFTGEAQARVLQPGARSVIVAVLDPSTLHGPQSRHLTIVSTDGERTLLNDVAAAGYVLRDQSEGEIRFAEDLGRGLRTDTTVNHFRKDKMGDYVLTIPLYNDTDKEVRLDVEAPGRLKIYAPTTLAPRTRADLRGIYTPRWPWWRREVRETLRIRVDGKEVAPLQIIGTIYQ